MNCLEATYRLGIASIPWEVGPSRPGLLRLRDMSVFLSPDRLEAVLLRGTGEFVDPNGVFGAVGKNTDFHVVIPSREIGNPSRLPFTSASACSSQYVMPISRYIDVAVVRCFCACSRLPVRR